VLLALGGVAAAATQDSWVDGYGIIAYFLVPLAFIPLAAGVIASPRANRFVESLFTAPVERRDWFVAKILVLVTLAAAYYVALMRNALGCTLCTGMIPASTTMPWLASVVLVVGSIIIATWTFVRLQGIETWEATRGESWLLTVALIAMCAFPVLTGDVDYDAA